MGTPNLEGVDVGIKTNETQVFEFDKHLFKDVLGIRKIPYFGLSNKKIKINLGDCKSLIKKN